MHRPRKMLLLPAQQYLSLNQKAKWMNTWRTLHLTSNSALLTLNPPTWKLWTWKILLEDLQFQKWQQDPLSRTRQNVQRNVSRSVVIPALFDVVLESVHSFAWKTVSHPVLKHAVIFLGLNTWFQWWTLRFKRTSWKLWQKSFALEPVRQSVIQTARQSAVKLIPLILQLQKV